MPDVGLQQPAQHADRRRLAGAVGAEEAEDLALLHRERQIVDGDERAEAARQAADVDAPRGQRHGWLSQRAFEPRLGEPHAGQRARARQLRFEQRHLRDQDVGAGRDAGAESIGDDAAGFGGAANGIGRGADHRLAGFEIEEPLPDIRRHDRVEFGDAARASR